MSTSLDSDSSGCAAAYATRVQLNSAQRQLAIGLCTGDVLLVSYARLFPSESDPWCTASCSAPVRPASMDGAAGNDQNTAATSPVSRSKWTVLSLDDRVSSLAAACCAHVHSRAHWTPHHSAGSSSGFSYRALLGGVSCLAWSSDGTLLAVGWLHRGYCVYTLGGERTACTVPHVESLLSTTYSVRASGSAAGSPLSEHAWFVRPVCLSHRHAGWVDTSAWTASSRGNGDDRLNLSPYAPLPSQLSGAVCALYPPACCAEVDLTSLRSEACGTGVASVSWGLGDFSLLVVTSPLSASPVSTLSPSLPTSPPMMKAAPLSTQPPLPPSLDTLQAPPTAAAVLSARGHHLSDDLSLLSYSFLRPVTALPSCVSQSSPLAFIGSDRVVRCSLVDHWVLS